MKGRSMDTAGWLSPLILQWVSKDRHACKKVTPPASMLFRFCQFANMRTMHSVTCSRVFAKYNIDKGSESFFYGAHCC